MARRITMRDVAAASGVSPATVGFVLNNTPNQSISAPTRARVLRAADELGYVVDGIARAMREGSSRVVVLNIDVTMEGNYSKSYIGGLDDELALHDHTLVVKHGHPSPESTAVLQHMLAPRAVIDFAAKYGEGRELDDGGWTDGMAAHTAVQIGHLADRGHQRVALARSPRRTVVDAARARLASEAARRRSLAPLEHLTLPASPEGDLAPVAVFLERSGVTAVAGATDEVALGMLKIANRLGVRVPDDLAVIGYDATEYAALSTPGLTTVLIDAEANGRRTARRLLGLSEDGLLASPARVVVREST